MRKAATAMACLACVGRSLGHGELEVLMQHSQHSPYSNRPQIFKASSSWSFAEVESQTQTGPNTKGTINQLKVLATLLLSFNSAVAHQGSRVVEGTRTVSQTLTSLHPSNRLCPVSRRQSLGNHAIQMSDGAAPTVITATGSLPAAAPAEVYELLSSADNWPEVFLSSVKVNTDGTALCKGMEVEELAGLPPLLPLQLVWECQRADPNGGMLELASEGSEGLLTDYTRRLTISSDAGSGSRVELETKFTSGNSLFAVVIALLIRLDHVLFDSVLLPSAIEKGGISRKSLLVWSVLITGWAVSSFGWMTMTGAKMAL